MSTPYIAITNVVTNENLGCTVSMNHSTPSASASIECTEHNLDLGDYVEIDMGNTDSHGVIFRGYVKSLTRNVPSNTTTIDCQDKFVRAAEYFIASSDPENPLTYSNINAEDLIENVLTLAGLTSFEKDSTYFTLGVNDMPVEINLVAAYDFCKQIADIVTWSFWYDSSSDKVYIKNRKPFPMYGDSGQPGDFADTGIAYEITGVNQLLDYKYTISEKDLRNKVVVYGANNITSTASEESPWLPTGFYKTSVIALPTLINDQGIADDTATYNLYLLHRLSYTLNCSIDINHTILPRDCMYVTLAEQGIARQLWYVYSVNHTYTNSGATTELELKTNELQS